MDVAFNFRIGRNLLLGIVGAGDLKESSGAVALLGGSLHCRFRRYARIGFTTSPEMSVRRKYRPWNL
jgi:hypothetical protein